MAYSSTPYVGIAQEKMAATSKVYKWHVQNVCVRLVNSLYEPYQALSSASMGNRPLTLLESIAKVPDLQVAKMGKLSTFWLSSSFFSPPR